MDRWMGTSVLLLINANVSANDSNPTALNMQTWSRQSAEVQTEDGNMVVGVSRACLGVSESVDLLEFLCTTVSRDDGKWFPHGSTDRNL